jgi:hypothetical protein
MYDEDDSGAIDAKELQKLCKDLGVEVSDDQLEEALRDLDMNGDGVVDFDEFKRWWFSGMKPYSANKRALNIAGNAANKLGDFVKKNGPLRELLKDPKNLETTTQKVSFSFNEPDYAETELLARVNLTGPDYFKWLDKAK